jgi:hypothetical protein
MMDEESSDDEIPLIKESANVTDAEGGSSSKLNHSANIVMGTNKNAR